MTDRKVFVYCCHNGEDVFAGYLACFGGSIERAAFQYAESWLEREDAFALDPSLYLTGGVQYTDKPLFGCFTDCSPDRWGRLLMNRFEQNRAAAENRRARTLTETDYMMLVNDTARQGALRFKDNPEGDFIFPPENRPVPPLVRLPELLSAAGKIGEHKETPADLQLLVAPGSSLGGARPKASVIDEDGDLCIAKFPKKDDYGNAVLWEAVALSLAKSAGINVPAHQVKEAAGKSVLIIKRFDRIKTERLPFASAMTLLGASDGDRNYSYLNIADIIRQYGSEPETDLAELWRRIVFSVCISDTDDHLRNHGFLRTDRRGWRLSPVYDINPDIDNTGYLSTMISEGDYSASLENAMYVAGYFGLSENKAKEIAGEVEAAVSQWRKTAKRLGLSQSEINGMSAAFKV